MLKKNKNIFFIRLFQVDAADPAFPRATGYWWFGCRSANRGTLGNVQWKNLHPVHNSFDWMRNLENVGGDLIGKNDDDDNHDQVGDIILDAGIQTSRDIRVAEI